MVPTKTSFIQMGSFISYANEYPMDKKKFKIIITNL